MACDRPMEERDPLRFVFWWDDPGLMVSVDEDDGQWVEISEISYREGVPLQRGWGYRRTTKETRENEGKKKKMCTGTENAPGKC
jgi:hypothetical protein